MAQVKVQTSAPLAGPGLSPGVPPAAMASPGSLGLQPQQPSVNGTGPAPTPGCLAPSVGYGDDPVSATSPGPPQENMANPKEKTPMCLVNELARFNRIQPQYKLLNERGPAHAKIFTVQLSLGDQVWEAEGTSIKKAQHTTASRALTESLLPRPAPRSPKVDINSNPGSITPTVELNGLAMKRGEPAIYRPLDPKPMPNYRANYNFRGMFNQREREPSQARVAEVEASDDERLDQDLCCFMVEEGPDRADVVETNSTRSGHRVDVGVAAQPVVQYHPQVPGHRCRGDFDVLDGDKYHYPIPKIFYVQLSVGVNEFIGEGRTRQAARHSAAMKALQALRHEPIPERPPQTPEEKEEQEEGGGTTTDASKSEISLVYEIALKRNLSVNFEVLKESGPPHMKSFLTRVSVGEFSAEGEGNSKKLSKKRAALSILQDLRKLPFMPAVEKPKTHYKKRPKTIIKVREAGPPAPETYAAAAAAQKTGPDYGQGMNPISRLAQIQQAKKEKEPEYLLLSERGMPRRREFIMQVKVNGEVATGTGPNKKVAKRNAAEAMLLQQGYKASVTPPTATELDNKGWNGQKAPFTEAASNTQKGLLHLSPDVYQEMEASRMQGGGGGGGGGPGLGPGPGPGPGPGGNYLTPKDPVGPAYYGLQASPPSPTATMARELLLNGQAAAGDAPSLGLKGKSPASSCPSSSSSSSSSSSCPSSSSSLVSVQPAQQLDYLARIQGFQVQYSDGQSGKEFVTYLTLSPVQMTFHGTGSTLQASHDQAALSALKQLSEQGLDAVDGPIKSSEACAREDEH